MRTTSHRAERRRSGALADLEAELRQITESRRLSRWDPPASEAEELAVRPGSDAPEPAAMRWNPADLRADPMPPGVTGSPTGEKGRMGWIVLILLLIGAFLAGSLAAARQTLKRTDEAAAIIPASAPQEIAVDRKIIGDWVYGCVRDPRAESKQCSIRQQLAEGNTKTPVFSWTIGADAKGDLVAVWQTPTGVLVGRGVTLDLGGEKPIVVPYRACRREQCEAVANLAPGFIEKLAKAEKVTATIIAESGKGLLFRFGVKGLAEGLAALKKE